MPRPWRGQRRPAPHPFSALPTPERPGIEAPDDPPPGLRDPSLFRTDAFIDGAWVTAAEGATIEIVNPATGDHLGTVPDMGTTETRAAVDAATAAWAMTCAREAMTLAVCQMAEEPSWNTAAWDGLSP